MYLSNNSQALAKYHLIYTNFKRIRYSETPRTCGKNPPKFCYDTNVAFFKSKINHAEQIRLEIELTFLKLS